MVRTNYTYFKMSTMETAKSQRKGFVSVVSYFIEKVENIKILLIKTFYRNNHHI